MNLTMQIWLLVFIENILSKMVSFFDYLTIHFQYPSWGIGAAGGTILCII